MKINVVQIAAIIPIQVRRDFSYLLTDKTRAWLTERNPVDDFDYSDEYREQDGC